jgi:MFS family permease
MRRLLAQSRAAFAGAFRNRAMRRLQLAGIGSTLGIWAYGVAIAVYAYRRDGATAVGLLFFVRWSLAGAFAPWLAVLADRMPRRRVMLAADVARAALVVGIASADALGGSAFVVYALAVAASIAGAAFAPAQSALMPSLAETPEELTSANVAMSTTASIGMFAGPALAGALLAVGSTSLVFAITAASFVWSALCVAGIPLDPAPAAEGGPEPVGAAFAAGLRGIVRDARLALVIGLTAAQTLVAGALQVLLVVVALRLLHAGNGGVGWLNAALGVGSVAGGIGASLLVGRRGLALALGGGLVLFGLPLALTAAVPRLAAAVVLFAAIGVGSTIVDVAGITLLQRTSGDELLGRVFGVLESLIFLSLAVGAGLTPPLVRALGPKGALVAVGAVLPLLCLLLWPRLRSLEADAVVPDEPLALLRSIPIFAPLPGPVLEQLAAGAALRTVVAGEAVVEQGRSGDLFYAIASGTASTEVDGRTVRELGPGDFFGEMGVLKNEQRNATVVAKTPMRLLTLSHWDVKRLRKTAPDVLEQLQGVLEQRET